MFRRRKGASRQDAVLEIRLTGNQQSYYTGDLVSGVVVLTVNEPNLALTSLKLYLVGKEVISEYLARNKGTDSECEFLCVSTSLVTYKKTEGERLFEGNYQFEFYVRIPFWVPPSCHIQGCGRVNFFLLCVMQVWPFPSSAVVASTSSSRGSSLPTSNSNSKKSRRAALRDRVRQTQSARSPSTSSSPPNSSGERGGDEGEGEENGPTDGTEPGGVGECRPPSTWTWDDFPQIPDWTPPKECSSSSSSDEIDSSSSSEAQLDGGGGGGGGRRKRRKQRQRPVSASTYSLTLPPSLTSASETTDASSSASTSGPASSPPPPPLTRRHSQKMTSNDDCFVRGGSRSSSSARMVQVDRPYVRNDYLSLIVKKDLTGFLPTTSILRSPVVVRHQDARMKGGGKGTLSFVVQLPNGAVLARGSEVPVHLSVKNGTARKLTHLILKLERSVFVFLRGQRTKVDKKTVVSKQVFLKGRSTMVCAPNSSAEHVVRFHVPRDISCSIVYGPSTKRSEIEEEEEAAASIGRRARDSSFDEAEDDAFFSFQDDPLGSSAVRNSFDAAEDDAFFSFDDDVPKKRENSTEEKSLPTSSSSDDSESPAHEDEGSRSGPLGSGSGSGPVGRFAVDDEDSVLSSDVAFPAKYQSSVIQFGELICIEYSLVAKLASSGVFGGSVAESMRVHLLTEKRERNRNLTGSPPSESKRRRRRKSSSGIGRFFSRRGGRSRASLLVESDEN